MSVDRGTRLLLAVIAAGLWAMVLIQPGTAELAVAGPGVEPVDGTVTRNSLNAEQPIS